MKKNVTLQENNPAEAGNGKYEEFLKKVRLVNFGLTHCACQLGRGAYSDIKKRSQKLSADYRLAHIGKGFFDATASFKLSIDDRERQSEEAAPLVLECSYEAHFHVEGAFTRAFAQAFVDGELRLVIWPYFRQLVTDMTARMTIEPIVIPFSTRSS